MFSPYLLCLAAFTGLSNGDLTEKYSWKSLDIAYPTEAEKSLALADESFIPENNLPTGISVWTNKKIFLSIPRRAQGIPATLVYFSPNDLDKSPKLIPYPTLGANDITDCNNLISVNRGQRIDKYDRLWVFDSGKLGKGKDAVQHCPPRIHVFDLSTDEKLRTYPLKLNDTRATSIYTSVVVDSGSTSEDVFMYLADQVGIIVYSWKQNDSWRFDHPYFWPDPIFGDYNIGGVNFQWSNAGVFGLALSPIQPDGFKKLYFHAISSFREFLVSTEILQDKNKVSNNFHDFKIVGSRESLGHVSTHVVAKNGVLFFNLIDKNAVGCWNTNTPYIEDENLAIVAKDDVALIFPSDSIVDGDQNLWILSNRLPVLYYGKKDFSDTNFRILSASVSDLIFNTACDPFFTSSPKVSLPIATKK